MTVTESKAALGREPYGKDADRQDRSDHRLVEADHLPGAESDDSVAWLTPPIEVRGTKPAPRIWRLSHLHLDADIGRTTGV